ncbi:MAG: DUF2249 domain-containing protein [Sphingobacteriales bacterium]|nr:DUF2249 domain-containing protein [Sphingobacteriales bacterium]
MESKPAILNSLEPGQLVPFDVRPVLSGGADPLQQILAKISGLQEGQVLQIINTFKPMPLITLLKKKGYSSFTEVINEQLIHTFFYKDSVQAAVGPAEAESKPDDWESVEQRFNGKTKMVDVRHLEMPGPMLTILGELDGLAEGEALFVHHKKIPVYLLPELADRKFDYRIREIREGDVHLLIFRK